MTTFRHGANIPANGIRQHVLRYGGAGLPPLLLIPGITSPAITWGFVAERLGAVFDTHVVDVRGRGLSSGGPDLDYGVDALAADAAALATALGLTDYIVMGHSMGARVAARACAGFGMRPAQVVMVDPPVSGPGRREYPAKLPWYVDSIAEAMAGMTAEDMRRYCPTWTEAQRALRAEWLHTCDPGAIRRAFADFHDTDFHADLPALPADTALIVAGKGGVILPADEAEIAALRPGIAITRVPNGGHMIPWDEFDGFFAAVSEVTGRRV